MAARPPPSAPGRSDRRAAAVDRAQPQHSCCSGRVTKQRQSAQSWQTHHHRSPPPPLSTLPRRPPPAPPARLPSPPPPPPRTPVRYSMAMRPMGFRRGTWWPSAPLIAAAASSGCSKVTKAYRQAASLRTAASGPYLGGQRVMGRGGCEETKLQGHSRRVTAELEAGAAHRRHAAAVMQAGRPGQRAARTPPLGRLPATAADGRACQARPPLTSQSTRPPPCSRCPGAGCAR